jgi:hypothetical protein
MQAVPALKRILRYAAIGMLVTSFFWAGRVLDLFRLDPNDSVYDYHRANVRQVVSFRMKVCHNGECLTPRDWACGFDNGDQEKFDACFDEVVDAAKLWVCLDRVRKFCGNRTMTFVGTVYSNPKRCSDAGGQWGVPSSPPHIAY